MNRTVTLILFLSFFGLSSCATMPDFPKGKLIDLTYPFNAATIYWPTEEGFVLENEFEGITQEGYYYYANKMRLAEHGGTHIDSPRHFAKGQWTVDEIPLERLMGRGVVVDVSFKCLQNPDYQVTIEDFLEWEKAHGRIPDDAFIFLKTGFGSFWPDRVRYMGSEERGAQAVKKLHFPGLHPEAALWLVSHRHPKAVGLDTPSIDYGQSELFETHVNLFKHNVLALENVANFDQLPPQDFYVMAFPMKIEKGSGGPTRIVAILKE